MKIAILPGDGIGTEIMAEAVNVLQALDLKFEMESALVGGAPATRTATRCPRARCAGEGGRRHPLRRGGRLEVRQAGAQFRPEQAILGLRKHLGLFANFRPAIC